MYKVMATYGLLNSQWSLILTMVTFASPYAIWVLKQYADKLPRELDEAAHIDGASPLQLFRLVFLPLMVPCLVADAPYALLLARSEEHASELQSLMGISYAVFALKHKTHTHTTAERRFSSSK